MYRFGVRRDLRGCDIIMWVLYVRVLIRVCARLYLLIKQTNYSRTLSRSPREEARVVQIGRIMMLRLWAITKEAAMAAIHA